MSALFDPTAYLIQEESQWTDIMLCVKTAVPRKEWWILRYSYIHRKRRVDVTYGTEGPESRDAMLK